MLRKIDCVMIRVEDVDASAAYYAKFFGLRPKWSGEGAVGLVFPETDAEIVLHRETTIPSSVEVHYLVDDVVVAVSTGFDVMSR
jgi:catechol 2,3-dioxygenase-like lactoylglutathione lyase family enzyme